LTTIDFGLMLQAFPTNFPGTELFDYNRRLIRMLPPGFTTIWTEDHFHLGARATHECLTTLIYFAAEFPRFRVGSLVLAQSYRNPALVAKMAATLQLLSKGRFILGLGAGWKEDEYRAYGYAFPPPKTRLAELEEAVKIIKAMWSERPATVEGQHYAVHGAYCEPQPSPAIPLLIGGGGERKTLELVARYADWWNFNSCTVEAYARKVAILRDHCQRLGRNLGEIKLTYLGTVSVSEKPQEVVRSAEKHFIAGNSAEVIRELEQFHEIGVTHFMFRFLDPESLERFATTVVPHFAGRIS
jgi:alkanesulfonate monooxygenase SsuD/methylene tetrahydromethanopterin reductase-like flavin-dependent oxidoreductase (luciferase family)